MPLRFLVQVERAAVDFLLHLVDLFDYVYDLIRITQKILSLRRFSALRAREHIYVRRYVHFCRHFQLFENAGGLRIILHYQLLFEKSLLFGLDSIKVLEYLLRLAIIADIYDKVNLLVPKLVLAELRALFFN